MSVEDDNESKKAPLLQTSSSASVSRRPLMYGSINSDPDDVEAVRNSAIISRYKYYSRLAPHPNNPMVIPDHVVPSELWTHIPVKPAGKQGSLITIFSIWNTMMGTSLLSMPWAVGQAGFALGLALLIFMAFLTLYTAYLVMKSVDTIEYKGGDVLEFSDVCRYYLGKVGESSAVIFSVIGLLGGAIVYWVLMSNFLFNAVSFIYNDVHDGAGATADSNLSSLYNDQYIHCSNPDIKTTKDYSMAHQFSPAIDSHNMTTITPAPTTPSDKMFHDIWNLHNVPFFLLLVLVPLINFKSPTFFTKFNALGTISVLYLLFFVTYKACIWGFHMDFSKVPGTYAKISFPALTGVLSLAYFIHCCVLSIVRNQAKPQNNGRDLSIAFFCVALTYCYVGAMFYAAWPMKTKECIDQNLLNNLLTSDPLAFVARIFLFVQMLTVFPLLLYIMRVQVMHAVFGSIWPSWKHVVAMNLIIVGICVVFARFYPKIGSIIRYTGAFVGLVYSFFLPCATYILSEKGAGKLTAVKTIVHVTIVVLGLVNFIAQFLV